MSAMMGDAFVARLVNGYHSLSILHRSRGAVLYRALQEGTDTPAALKVLRLDDGEAAAQTAGGDIAVLRRVSAHPHIVDVLGWGITTTGRPYLAMDYLEDGSYQDLLAGQGPLPVAEALSVGRAIADALAAAHDDGILHGAVTPANILRSEAGPQLTDFPAARAPARYPGASTVSDSAPHHASPEALRGQHLTSASDVYSLASTLWTLLTGHLPYAEEPAPEFFSYRHRVLGNPGPPIHDGTMPPDLVEVLVKGLAMTPEDRYTDPRTFSMALSKVNDTEPEVKASFASPGLPPPPPSSPSSPSSPSTPSSKPKQPDPDPVAPVEDDWLDVSDLPASESVLGMGPDLDPEPEPFPEPPIMPEAGPEPGPEPGQEPGWPDLDPDFHEPEPPDLPPSPRERVRPSAAPGGRRPAYLGFCLAGIAIGLGVTVILAVGNGGWRDDSDGAGKPAKSAKPSGSPIDPRTGARYTPQQVQLVDRQIIADLTWQDRSAGAAAHYVVGGPIGRTPTTLARVPVKVAKAEVTGLNPSVDYCFTVVAILAVDKVAAAQPVCTRRGV